jgi:hypothetical protein
VTGSSLRDSIVADNTGSTRQFASCRVNSSLVTPGSFPGQSGNFGGDPDFVAPEDGVFDIGPASDAIDRAEGTQSLDIHGEPRESPADVGADEYHEP